MASKPFYSLSEIIQQLTASAHAGTPWTATALSFSFPTELSPDHAGQAGAETFSPLIAEQQAAVRLAMANYAEIIDVSFTEVAGNAGDIRFHNLGSLDGAFGQAFAAMPGPGTGGDVFFSPSDHAYHDLLHPVRGDGHGFNTYLHEIGHAMGLAHAGNYNGGSPTYAADALFQQDTEQYTVMSYFWAADGGADQFYADDVPQFAETLMLYDIAALQALYGANMATRSGATTYGFNANAGAPYDFAGNRDPMLSIYDAGGLDTLDFSGFSGATVLDLNAGAFSSTEFMTDNVSIAFGVVIENGVGGAGADVLRGNAARNLLTGGAGNDSLSGGEDVDTAGYGGVRADYAVTHQGGLTVSGGPDGTDTLSGIERLAFADGTLAFDVTGDAGRAYRLYEATFDRIPDAPGLGYWIRELDAGRADLPAMAGSFIGSAEFVSTYGTPGTVSDGDFLALLYNNVLARNPEGAGEAYWLETLGGGTPRHLVLAAFSESPENQANLAGAMADGIWYV